MAVQPTSTGGAPGGTEVWSSPSYPSQLPLYPQPSAYYPNQAPRYGHLSSFEQAQPHNQESFRPSSQPDAQGASSIDKETNDDDLMHNHIRLSPYDSKAAMYYPGECQKAMAGITIENILT